MSTNNDISIYWIRNDLRISDNLALLKSSEFNNVIPIFILDNVNSEENNLGGASRWWLHNSLKKLNSKFDNKISFYKGDPIQIFKDIEKKLELNAVFWNRSYEPWSIERDKKIKKYLTDKNIKVYSYNSSLLWEPTEILKSDKTPYKVFTPFYRKGCLVHSEPRLPRENANLNHLIKDENNIMTINSLGLLDKFNWYENFDNHWNVGEEGALEKLQIFLSDGLDGYKNGRNFPMKQNVSQLSPYLHFGEISPNKVWYESNKYKDIYSEKDISHFQSELAWREFSYYLLFHFPHIINENLQSKFDNFEWDNNLQNLERWKKGKTGYPIIDAGMRELWNTGYMHNRVRMIVGSFLVKNLLLHWKLGERWFWDCLVDSDLASNTASWQWVAGTGADAAPYFRIFNPVTQGIKFDPQGEYIKKHVPELKDLDIKYLYSPWEASTQELEKANIFLGQNYPNPIIDLKDSRNKALENFSNL